MKDLTRRIISLLIAAATALTALFSAASGVTAAGSNPSYTTAGKRTDDYSSLRSVIPEYDGLFSFLYASVSGGEMTVDVKRFRLKQEHVVGIFTDLVSSSPELFYLNSMFSYEYQQSVNGSYVNKIFFSYKMQGKELLEAQAVFNSEIEYLASLVDPSLSDAEKALWLHDYLISVFSYDTSLTIYDAYNMLLNETGVCRAYSLIYSAVLNRLGIGAFMVVTDNMAHAWNMVNIDGNWYHVDLTFDDPTGDRTGRAMHDYFLLTDEELTSLDSATHTQWRTSLRAGTPYPGPRFWDGVESRMTYVGGRWYYADSASRSLVSVTSDGEGPRTEAEIPGRWYTSPDRSVGWIGVFSGTFEYGGEVFFNTPDTIRSYDPVSGTVRTVYADGDGKQIIGIAFHKDNVYIHTSYDMTETVFGEVEKIPSGDLIMSFGDMGFDDVPADHRYYYEIASVVSAGIFNGTSATTFSPDATLTRAMFVTILGRLSGIDAGQYSSSYFSDVSAGSWYHGYVGWAVSNGLVSGVGGGRFSPDAPITREQMFKIASAYCGMAGYTPADAARIAFTDAGDISAWAAEGIRKAALFGLLDVPDDGTLRPRENATRAEAACVAASILRHARKP